MSSRDQPQVVAISSEESLNASSSSLNESKSKLSSSERPQQQLALTLDSDGDLDSFFVDEEEENRIGEVSKKRKREYDEEEARKNIKISESPQDSLRMASNSEEMLSEDLKVDITDCLSSFEAAKSVKKRAPVFWTGSFEPGLFRSSKTSKSQLPSSETSYRTLLEMDRVRVADLRSPASNDLHSSSDNSIITSARDLLSSIAARVP